MVFILTSRPKRDLDLVRTSVILAGHLKLICSQQEAILGLSSQIRYDDPTQGRSWGKASDDSEAG